MRAKKHDLDGEIRAALNELLKRPATEVKGIVTKAVGTEHSHAQTALSVKRGLIKIRRNWIQEIREGLQTDKEYGNTVAKNERSSRHIFCDD